MQDVLHRLNRVCIGVMALFLVGNAWANSKFEQDREAILAMAGNYNVQFQFDEVATFGVDTEASAAHRSEALEAVRIIADDGDFISLQHLLIVGAESDSPHLIKHWRQDWQYEPASYLSYIGNQTWKQEHLSPQAREGVWSQTVYQVDDGPRYGGVAAWSHEGGQSQWESNRTWRPLPRREHTKRDDYDVLVGVNRHVLTRNGWIHQQDNEKVAIRGADLRVLGREIGLNRYEGDTASDFSLADTYWDAHEDYWQAVRATWARQFAVGDRFRITERNAEGQQRAAALAALMEGFETHTENEDTAAAEHSATIEELLASFIERR